MGRASWLPWMFGGWAAGYVVVAAVCVRRAPAVTLALGGAVAGGVAAFLAGVADGPAGAPASAAVWATFGGVSNGTIGALATTARGRSEMLARAGAIVLLTMPLVAPALALLLRSACPLYISGSDAGVCDYQGVDQLGGWTTVVALCFAFDAVFIAVLLFVSARQARRAEDARLTHAVER